MTEIPKESADISSLKPKRQRLLEVVDEMIKSVENLPQHAKLQPITHYDYETLLCLLKALYESGDV